MRRSRLKSVCAQALGIERKNIYRTLRLPRKDAILKARIQAVHQAHPAYGHRRVALHLGINRKRAQRVMSTYNLRPPRRRTKTYSTRSTTHHHYKNQLKRLETITQPHQVWCSDLTRLVYHGTIWYLASIEDVATRQIVARQLGKHHDRHLVFSTLKQALRTEPRPNIFHSDQGNEFMARLCTDYLEQHDITISVSDVASPWQNGYCESFFGRFKHELGDLNRFDTVGQMIEAVYAHIHYSNTQRIHTALKMTPAQFAHRASLRHLSS